MTQELGPIDITDNPQLRALAEEVRASGKPRTLVRDHEAVAVLTPAPAARRHRGGRPRPDGVRSLRNLVGLATSRDGATDVSSNKHKYLAEAYLPKKEA
jgi:hypothetical protein